LASVPKRLPTPFPSLAEPELSPAPKSKTGNAPAFYSGFSGLNPDVISQHLDFSCGIWTPSQTDQINLEQTSLQLLLWLRAHPRAFTHMKQYIRTFQMAFSDSSQIKFSAFSSENEGLPKEAFLKLINAQL